MSEPDRINVSLGMKIPGPQEYSSISFHVSLSSDAKPKEKTEALFERVKEFVEEKVEGLYDKYGTLQEGKDDDEDSDEEEEVEDDEVEEED